MTNSIGVVREKFSYLIISYEVMQLLFCVVDDAHEPIISFRMKDIFQ